jgi:hypothetical protein
MEGTGAVLKTDTVVGSCEDGNSLLDYTNVWRTSWLVDYALWSLLTLFIKLV